MKSYQKWLSICGRVYRLDVFYGKSARTYNNFVYYDIQLRGPLAHISSIY